MTAKERIVTLHPPYSEIRPTEIPEHEAPAYEKALSIPDMLETFPIRLYLSGINVISIVFAPVVAIIINASNIIDIHLKKAPVTPIAVKIQIGTKHSIAIPYINAVTDISSRCILE